MYIVFEFLFSLNQILPNFHHHSYKFMCKNLFILIFTDYFCLKNVFFFCCCSFCSAIHTALKNEHKHHFTLFFSDDFFRLLFCFFFLFVKYSSIFLSVIEHNRIRHLIAHIWFSCSAPIFISIEYFHKTRWKSTYSYHVFMLLFVYYTVYNSLLFLLPLEHKISNILDHCTTTTKKYTKNVRRQLKQRMKIRSAYANKRNYIVKVHRTYSGWLWCMCVNTSRSSSGHFWNLLLRRWYSTSVAKEPTLNCFCGIKTL